MRVLVIVNEAAGPPRAGDAEDLPTRIRRGFARNGVEATVRATASTDLAGLADEGSLDGFDAVVAGGGDGTVHGVANAVRDRIAMGVLPLGTHNHFAKDLGMPLELDAAIDALAKGRPEPFDVAEVDDRLFVNFSALGIHPHVVADREEQRRATGRGKLVAMAVATWRTLFRLPLMVVRLSSTAHPALRRLTPSVIVCTNPHQMALLGLEGVSYAGRGLLNVYVAHSRGPLGTLWLILRALFRRLGDARRFEALAVPDVTVDRGVRSVLVSLDGEVAALRSPLRYRILRGGLRVVRPPPGDVRPAAPTAPGP
jgi:diacylglycerol kinase family enzyme